jgi:polysaccharide biosynthesis/export protein
MYSQDRFSMTKFALILTVLLALSSSFAIAQDAATQPGSDSQNMAKPVLPATSDAGKDVAKATPLPTTDTPATRVSKVVPEGYVIGIGDALDINVWKEGELSKPVMVRPDGMITLPLVGEIKAQGLTPNELQDQLTTALGKVLSDPQVTVIVVSVNSLSFNIMGNVLKPGYYPLNHPVSVLDAIALSGGFKDFAKEKKIYILRTAPNGKQEKLYFNYKQVIKGQKMAQNIILQPRDTLVVP